MQENEFIVKAVAFHTSPLKVAQWEGYSDDRKLLGYLPMIFGTSWFGGYSCLCSAVAHADVSWRDPASTDLYESEQEAMNAWETGTPVEMPHALKGKNKITSESSQTIDELGLYRKVK